MLNFLKSDTFRRVCAALVGVAGPFINQKLGLNIPPEQVIAGMIFVAGYIGQSVVNSMHARSVAAGAAAVAVAQTQSPSDALAAAPKVP